LGFALAVVLLQKLTDRPEILTVLHAGDQDLDLIYQRSGLVPQNISDTQIAAGFIGFGYPVGYGKLLHQLLDIAISKTESFTDWTNRPLTDSQIDYALDDVAHLLALHDALSARLNTLGRNAWVMDECKRYADPRYYEKDRGRDFLRIKGASGLGRRGLAVLKQLSDWRHGEAAASNRPLKSILADNIMIEFAKHPPRKMADIQKIRGVRPDQVKHYGNDVLEAVAAALTQPESEWPSWPTGRIPTRREVITADVLFTLMKIMIFDLDLAPELVATRSNMETLVRIHPEGAFESSKLPLLHGWRWELVGCRLVEILDGSSCTLKLSSGESPIDLEVNGKGVARKA
jgi:ribonuclease D